VEKKRVGGEREASQLVCAKFRHFVFVFFCPCCADGQRWYEVHFGGLLIESGCESHRRFGFWVGGTFFFFFFCFFF